MKVRLIHLPLFGMLLALGACYFFVFLLAFWAFWPYQPLVIKNYSPADTVHTSSLIYHMGDAVGYTLNYCKNTSVPATVTRILVDGQQILLSGDGGSLAQGCHEALVQTAIIPTTINPGKYHLDITVHYQMNPIQNVAVHYVTNSFSVIR